MHIRAKVVKHLHFLRSNVQRFSTFYLCLAGLCFAGLGAARADAAPVQRVAHRMPDAVAQLTPLGPLASTNRLNLAISLPLRNQAALAELLKNIYDPHSSQFHHFLTPAEFAAQFGPSEADYQSVIQFARAHGLEVTATHPNRLLLDVGGSVPAVETALHVKMRRFQHPSENRTFYAPDTDPTLDLSTPILQISGLDNYALPRPHFVARPLSASANAQPNAGSGPNGTYSGYDFRAAYVPDTTLTGTGQSVGLLQFDGYTPADITYYVNQAGLPAVPLQNVLLDGFDGLPTYSGGEVEVSLDIEMANSMAPGLSKIIVYMAGPFGSWHDILNRMATDDSASQLSCSWYIPGGVADPTADAIFQQMASQGQSFLSASGDDDAYTGLINFPSDSPYITQVGGTTLTTTGPKGTYVSETAWNWNTGIGTGGGISTQYPIPTWQTNISMKLNQGSTTQRNTPDVALTADNVYVRADGGDYKLGGTSCATPLWAAFTSLVNQLAIGSGRPPVGFLNPAVYALGAGTPYATTFHDITVGNNESSASPTRFKTAPGYDLCTGWGTPAGQNLINALANPEPLLITPQTGFTSAGRVGGPFTVNFQTLTLTNTGTNTLNWSLVSTSAWLAASPASGSLTPGGTATQVTASLTSAANNLGLGAYSATVWFTNLNDNAGQSRIFTISVITPPTITTQPTNQTVLEGEAAAFNGTAIGGQPLAYQWLNNGMVLTNGSTVSGATTTNLTISGVVASEAGTISLVVTNAAGSVTSNPALLTLPLSKPIFTLQPTNETFYQTQTAEFAVAVVGTEPYSFQWTLNGQNLAGATNATLVLAKLQLDQAGNYAVVVTNSQGSATSASAALTVTPLPPCAPVGDGMVSWWAGEDNADDSLGLNNGALVGGVTFVPGVVGQAFSLNGTNGYVSIPDSPSLDALTGTFTVEAWIKVTQFSSQDWISIICKGDTSWQLRRYGTGSTLSFWTDGLSNPELEGNHNINDGQWHHVAGVYDGTTKYIYVDGTLDVSEPATGTIAVSAYPLLIGDNPESLQRLFNGLVDEVSVYNRALSAAEIQSIYVAGIGGKCPVPLSIVTQPTNEIANTGDTATFAVVATGPQPLSYQWNFDGTNISGATNAILTLSNVTTNNNGIYAVTVANPSGSITSSNVVLTVLAPSPTILTQPASQTNFAGTTATFSITVAGTPPLSYQWTFNGTNLTGMTNAMITLVDVQPGESGNYAVIVTNLFGSATSSNAFLTILTQPPTILTQPVSQTNYVDETAYFSVTAAGSPPLSYQWSFNTTNLAGATNATLALNYLQLAQAGNYAVQVSSPYGSTNSATAVLEVNPAPPCAPVSKGMVSWWPGESSANDIVGTNNGTLVGGVTYAPGEVGQAFALDGNDYVSIPDAPSIDALTNAMTVEAWINVTAFSGQDWISIICKGDTSWQLRRYGTTSALSFWTDGLSNPELQGTRNVNDGKWHHVAGVYDGTNKYIYVDGTLDVSEPATGTIAVNSQPLLLGDNAGALQRSFDGLVDEVSIYNRALSAQEISTIYLAGSNGKCPPVPAPPGITTQPTNETVSADSTAFFTVTANGNLPLNYQWSFNGTNLAGATQPNLTLTNVQPSQAGNYTITITNLFGTVTSSPAYLTVATQPPTISTQPLSETNLVGTTASFSVSASGTAPLSYQWSLNATNLAGATNATLTLPNVQVIQSGNYVVTVANAYGSTNSANAVLTVIPAPSCDPAPAGLVNWWQGQNNANDSVGTNNGSLSGAVTYAAGEVGQAFVLNGSDYVSIPDSPAIDALTNAITIEAWIKVTQFSSQDWISIICKGDTSWQLRRYGATSTLSFWTDGLSNPEMQGSRNINDGQWHHVAGVYDGAKKYIYVDGTLDVSEPATGTIAVNTQPLLFGDNAGALQRNFNGLVDEVSLYNRALSATEIQTIYATGNGGKCPVPIVISTQPTNETVTPGHTVTLSVAATGMRPLLYQWNYYGTNLPGATNSTLILSNVQLANSGIYSATVANPYQSLTTTNALLTVASLPVITTQPASLTNLTGTTATFTVTAIGTPPLAYQWLYNTTNLTGATSPSLTLTNLGLAQAGTYTVLVTNQFGSAISSNALLVVNPSLRFVWNFVPSPRFVNTPFSVVVQAQTPTNGLATNFTSTVTLESTNGIPVVPAVSGNFIQGVWTGTVTVAQTATNLVLNAIDAAGESGVANPVNIVNLPTLTAASSSGTLLILWPVSPEGFVLEAISDLTQTNWQPVTTPPFPVGGQNLLSIPTSGTNAYYRLRFTGP